MSDVQTAPVKKTRQMSFTVLDDGNIRADFDGLDPLTFSPASLPEVILAAAVPEGIIARLRSTTSKLTDDDRTPENLRAAVAAGVASLQAGQWKIERAAGEGGQVSLEVEAAWLFKKMRAESKGETYAETLAEVAEAFGKLTDDPVDADGKPVLDEHGNKVLGQKSQLKALPRYKVAYAEVKAKRAAENAAKLAKKVSEDEEGPEGF